MSDFEESLSAEIATVNGKIDKVELEISSVETAITEAESHVLNNDNKEFWEPKLQQLREDKKQLREDKKQLRRKEEQLRDLVLLKEKQQQQPGNLCIVNILFCRFSSLFLFPLPHHILTTVCCEMVPDGGTHGKLF
jgi:hypothetical protein